MASSQPLDRGRGPEHPLRQCVETRRLEAIYDYRNAKLELYNLSNDIGEQKDLAAANPAKVRELALLLTKQLKAWDAQWPIFKATGKPVPFPDQVASKKNTFRGIPERCKSFTQRVHYLSGIVVEKIILTP